MIYDPNNPLSGRTFTFGSVCRAPAVDPSSVNPVMEVPMCPKDTCKFGNDGKCISCGSHRPPAK